MIAWLASVLRSGLDYLFAFSHNYWIAIVLLTLAIRVILVPFTAAQVRSTQTMQALQPEIEKIKKRFKGDPQRENQETLELWRKNKVNPMSGCLLLVIQLPVWWALFRVLQSAELMKVLAADPSSQLLFWNLAQPDKYFIWPILAAASTYWMSATMQAGQKMDPTTKTMNMMSPVIMLMISLKFPVALSLYFVFSNGLQVLQQLLTPKPKAITGEAD